MTAPAQIPPPEDSSNADEVIAALAALLLVGATAAGALKVLGLLKGAAKAAVTAIFTDRKFGKLLGKKVTKPGQNANAAAHVRYLADERAAAARAAYLVRATLRLLPAHASGDASIKAAANAREDSFAVAHAGATAHREAATTALLKVIGKRKPDRDGRVLLGWYADAQPCPVCLLADGTNFDALDPPIIGWPGHVHPHCYCTAGAPHDTDLMTDDVVSERGDPMDEVELRALVLEQEARASGLQATANGRKLWKWLTGAGGLSKFAGSPRPWQALVYFLVSKGVSPGVAKGEATNIMQASAAGKALFAKGHKGKHKNRSSDMNTETRAAVVTEIRGPGTAKPDETPGFTARMVSYNVPDSYRTSWRQGVFGTALENRSNAGHSIPVVWNHDPGDPVGQVVAYRDEPDAFYADVEFDDLEAVPRARQAHAQMRANAKTGKSTMGQFSFAFVRGEEEEDPQHRGVMLQTEVREVQEFSIVLNGAVPGTGPMAVRSAGRVDARAAADLIERFGRGEVDLTDALVELRSAAAGAPAPQFEVRAMDGADSTIKPLDVLAAVDTALVSVADSLDKGEVEAARQYFSKAASRLSELQYVLGLVPGVEGYGESYAWRKLEQGETRADEEKTRDQGPEREDDPFARLGERNRRAQMSGRRLDISDRWYSR